MNFIKENFILIMIAILLALLEKVLASYLLDISIPGSATAVVIEYQLEIILNLLVGFSLYIIYISWKEKVSLIKKYKELFVITLVVYFSLDTEYSFISLMTFILTQVLLIINIIIFKKVQKVKESWIIKKSHIYGTFLF